METSFVKYVSQVLKPSFYCKSDQHISVKIGNNVIVRVYFNPINDFDETIERLSKILEEREINSHTEIFIGGDFNIKPHKKNLKNRQNFYCHMRYP